MWEALSPTVKRANLFIFMQNIIPLSIQEIQITFQRQEDGYINATALCNNAGREFHTWNRSKATQEFLKELSAEPQFCGTELVQIQKGGEPHLQGTWVHPQVAINLSQWLSPKFAVQVSKWVNNWITQKQMPQQLSRLEILQIALESEKKVLELENTVKEKDNTIQEQNTQIENLQDNFKQIADKTGCVKMTECAYSLGLTRNEIRQILINKGWRWKDRHLPTKKGIDEGFVKLMTDEYKVKPKHSETYKKSSLAFYITEKGYNELAKEVVITKR